MKQRFLFILGGVIAYGLVYGSGLMAKSQTVLAAVCTLIGGLIIGGYAMFASEFWAER